MPTPSSWPRAAGNCVLLVEPDVLWSVLATSIIATAEINVLVIRDFEHYLDTCNACRKITPYFQRAPGRNENSPASMRILALVEGLQVCSLEALEKRPEETEDASEVDGLPGDAREASRQGGCTRVGLVGASRFHRVLL
ncbi:hypothetical protein MRX96_036634 [Rhipicephalus microplus]